LASLRRSRSFAVCLRSFHGRSVPSSS
jgi:hypothetical protein